MTPEEERRVVEEAARRIVARQWWSRGTGSTFGRSADEVIGDHLPEDAQLSRWAVLARAAFDRARELAGDDPRPGPSAPEGHTLRGGVPEFEERRGRFSP